MKQSPLGLLLLPPLLLIGATHALVSLVPSAAARRPSAASSSSSHLGMSASRPCSSPLEDATARAVSAGRASFVKWGREHAVSIPFPRDKGASNESGDGTAWDAEVDKIVHAVVRSSPDVVMLSEPFHNCREAMSLHCALIKRLVERHGFDAICTESGLPESRIAHQYVLGREGIEEREVWSKGINQMYSEWEEGRELVRWLREHNARIREDGKVDGSTTTGKREVHYYGIDIGGFYKDWSPGIGMISDYLKRVDLEYAEKFEAAIAPLMLILGTNARVNYQETMSTEEKYQLASIFEEVVDRFDENEREYVQRIDREDFEWAKQSAVSMQLAEDYYRNHREMLRAKANTGSGSGGGAGAKFLGLNGREVAMARNIQWAMRQRPNSKVIVIDHVVHTKTRGQHQDETWGHFVPAGQMVKRALEGEGKRLYVLGMTYGGGRYWNQWQTPEDRFADEISPHEPDGLEAAMKDAGGGKSVYFDWDLIDDETAVPFMTAETTIRENDYFIRLAAAEWNSCVHVDEASPATSAGKAV